MTVSAAIAGTSLTNRARITNGTVVVEGVDGRTRDGRRYRDLVDGYIAQFGAMDEGDIALCRGAARLTVMLERVDAEIVNGASVDLGDTARATSRLQRILRDLAGSQRARRRRGTP